MRIEEGADAGHHRDLACLGHAGEPAGEPADNFFLVGAQLVEIDLGLRKRDSVRGEGLHLVHHGRGVKQGFGGNAADIQAHPA